MSYVLCLLRVTIIISDKQSPSCSLLYADIVIFMLTSVYGNYYLVMGRVCITVNLLIDQNNILSAISRMTISVVASCFSTPPPPPPRLGGGGGVLACYCSFNGDKEV